MCWWCPSSSSPASTHHAAVLPSRSRPSRAALLSYPIHPFVPLAFRQPLPCLSSRFRSSSCQPPPCQPPFFVFPFFLPFIFLFSRDLRRILLFPALLLLRRPPPPSLACGDGGPPRPRPRPRTTLPSPSLTLSTLADTHLTLTPSSGRPLSSHLSSFFLAPALGALSPHVVHSPSLRADGRIPACPSLCFRPFSPRWQACPFACLLPSPRLTRIHALLPSLHITPRLCFRFLLLLLPFRVAPT
ncbi:hypothetical protein B0H10DRAFT_2007232, partial [Mycena sp. CBHHK59/15]